MSQDPITLYYYFLCPYAWRGLELAWQLRETRGLTFRLRHFSLVQGNHPENPERASPQWWLHQQEALGDAARASLGAFLADQAAARQGEAAHWAFALALFRARHAQQASLAEPATLEAAARQAGLDLARFQADLHDDQGLRIALGEDLQAAAQLRVFGTPTFVLPDGNAAYFRFARLPDPADAGGLWDLYTRTLTQDAHIETIKRPR